MRFPLLGTLLALVLLPSITDAAAAVSTTPGSAGGGDAELLSELEQLRRQLADLEKKGAAG
jgi:hypothetical protein